MQIQPLSPFIARVRSAVLMTSGAAFAAAATMTTRLRDLIAQFGTTTLIVRPLSSDTLMDKTAYTAMLQEAAADVSEARLLVPQLAQQGISISNLSITQAADVAELVSRLDHDVVDAEGWWRQHRPQRTGGDMAILPVAENGMVLDLSGQALHTGLDGVTYDAATESLRLRSRATLALQGTAQVGIDVLDADGRVLGLPGNTLELAAPTVGTFTSSGAELTIGASPIPSTYVGEHALASDPSALIDGNAATWFEFERVALRDAQGASGSVETVQSLVKDAHRWVTNQTGTPMSVANAITPDTWSVTLTTPTATLTVPMVAAPPQDGVVLRARFILPSATRLSRITLSPYLRSGTPAQLDAVSVVDAAGATHNVTLPTTSLASAVSVFVGDLPPIAEIHLSCSQTASYEMTAGHDFYLAEIQVKKSRLLQRSKRWMEYQRVASPTAELSLRQQSSLGGAGVVGAATAAFSVSSVAAINALGVSVASAVAGSAGLSASLGTLGALAGPVGWATVLIGGALIGALFGSRTTRRVVSVQCGTDAFAAKRWAIGLRDVEIAQDRYDTDGTMTLPPLTSAAEMTALSVLPEASAPSGTELTYAYTGDGASWIPLSPGVVTAIAPTRRIVVRAQFHRGADETCSPCLRRIRVEGRR